MRGWPRWGWFWMTVGMVLLLVGLRGAAIAAQPVSLYQLPYPSGVSALVIAGNGDGATHQNQWNRYAWDFVPLEGTGRSQQTSLNLDVTAARTGRVISLYQAAHRNWPCTRPLPADWFQFTNYVVLDHGDGESTLYAHLKQNSVPVQQGQVVQQGQKLGEMGDTGYACGVHLHYSVQQTPLLTTDVGNRSGQYWTVSLPSRFRDRATARSQGIPQFGQSYLAD